MAKILRANEHRRTRFHTERGDLLPVSLIPEAALSVARRCRQGAYPQGPWISPSAAAALEREIAPSWRVLELGAGSSTAWLARRGYEVVVLEADPNWARQTQAALVECGIVNVELIELSVTDTPSALADMAPDSFDLVTIDCYETAFVGRLDCLAAARHLVRPGGLLLLDDSDRMQLRCAPDLLPGWRVDRYIGIKQFPLMAIETTIFTRPIES